MRLDLRVDVVKCLIIAACILILYTLTFRMEAPHENPRTILRGSDGE